MCQCVLGVCRVCAGRAPVCAECVPGVYQVPRVCRVCAACALCVPGVCRVCARRVPGVRQVCAGCAGCVQCALSPPSHGTPGHYRLQWNLALRRRPSGREAVAMATMPRTLLQPFPTLLLLLSLPVHACRVCQRDDLQLKPVHELPANSNGKCSDG